MYSEFFDEFLRCGRLEHGFLRVSCGDCKHEKIIGLPHT
jgi:ribosomal protein S27E